MYTLYSLNCPITNDIRYIGQTSQKLQYRLKRHIYSSNKDKTYKSNWIQSLLKSGISPIIVAIETNLTKIECDILEKYYIKYYRSIGIKLTNSTDGGDGCVGYKHTDDTKIILSKHMKEINTTAHKEHLRKCGLRQWELTTEQDKLNNILNQKGRRDIYQYDLEGNVLNLYVSLRDIERKTGFFRANISQCLSGKFKQAYGYVWKYE